MEDFCKIIFKNKEYSFQSIVDFNSVHSKTSIPHNIFYITIDELPKGILTDIASKYAIKAIVLGEELWRPEIKLKTNYLKEEQKMQYTIIINDKGE